MNEKGIQRASSCIVKIGLDSCVLQEFKSTLQRHMGFYNTLEWTTCRDGIKSAHVHMHTLIETFTEQMGSKYSHLTCAGT